MSNLETIDHLVSILENYRDRNLTSRSRDRLLAVAHNAARYAFTLTEDERKKFVDILFEGVES